MMKPVLFAASTFLLLSVASSAALAYSGSECEVNDCSTKSTKANAAKGPAKAKTKAEVKAEVKTAAKSEAKAKALEKAPSSVRDLAGFLK